MYSLFEKAHCFALLYLLLYRFMGHLIIVGMNFGSIDALTMIWRPNCRYAPTHPHTHTHTHTHATSYVYNVSNLIQFNLFLFLLFSSWIQKYVMQSTISLGSGGTYTHARTYSLNIHLYEREVPHTMLIILFILLVSTNHLIPNCGSFNSNYQT